ncbi:NAD-binding protein [Dactylosporangium sp. NPDC051541]|uniref:NAD-binding protein n=1 Tax=Dactylosporangium sp. NPDC051541 TaxID=3363977 RepID=UPI0037989106
MSTTMWTHRPSPGAETSAPRRAVQLVTIHCDDDELDRVVTAALAAVPGADPGGLTLLTVGEDVDGPAAGTASDPLFGDLPRHQIIALVPSRPGPDAEAVLGHVRQLVSPFTTAERDRIARLNPLVQETVRRYRAAGTDLSAATVVFRDHLLLEKLNILDGLVALGLRPSACLVVGKPDRTVYRRRVTADLARSGFVVADPDDASFPVHRWLAAAAPDGPIVVVDDGGDLVLDLLARDGLRSRVRPIETTTKGIRVLRAAGLLDTVVNLSDTSTKSLMNRRIAVSCVYRFREILRHEALEGQGCIVVGYGRLGRRIAELLAGLGMVVRVVETDAAARQLARAAGFEAVADVRAATADGRSRFLFGCSGRPVVPMAAVRAMAANPVLVSASSQDLRPVLTHLRRHADARPVRNAGVRYELDGGTVTVIADGHAVNLYLAEGVSEPDYDPFTALMLTAVVETATGAPGRPDPELWCCRVADLQLELRD